MRNLMIAATVAVLATLASGQAFALNHSSGSKTFFNKESAKAQPQVDQAPAVEAMPAEPKAHKSHKRKH